MTDDDMLGVGVVTGAHGIRGALRVRLHDPTSRALRAGLAIELHGGAEVVAAEIDRISIVPHSNKARVFLVGTTTRDQAEALRGNELCVRRADLPQLEPDEFYLADTVGCSVVTRDDTGATTALGVVIGVVSNGAQDLLEVEWTSATGSTTRWLLPVTPSFIRDVDRANVVVDLPPGMLPEALEASR